MDDRPTIDYYTGIGMANFVDPGVFLPAEWDDDQKEPDLPSELLNHPETSPAESVDRECFESMSKYT